MISRNRAATPPSPEPRKGTDFPDKFAAVFRSVLVWLIEGYAIGGVAFHPTAEGWAACEAIRQASRQRSIEGTRGHRTKRDDPLPEDTARSER
jgi:uncharacterized protein YifN (PemK superfamily)